MNLKLERRPSIVFHLLVYGLYFVLGIFTFVRFNYGEVSWIQVVSIVNGNISLRELNLAVITNFFFLVSASLTLGWIFLKANQAISLRLQPDYPRKYIGPIAIVTAGLLGILLLLPSSATADRDTPTAKGLSPGALSAGSDVVHVFVESLVDKVSKGSSHTEIVGLVLEDAGLWTTNGLVALPGHDNTITGLVSAWCGREFPPFIFNDPTSSSFGMKDTICVHDVLKAQGFEMQFVSGYQASFQAKDAYLNSKDVRIFDLLTWLQIDSEGLDSWNGGLNDKQLFNNVKSIVQTNYLSIAPFYLSALTLDTHPPLRTPSYCHDEPRDEPSLLNVYECVSSELAKLVNWLRDNRQESRPLLVVIQGDHLPGFAISETSRSKIFFAATCLRSDQGIGLTRTPNLVTEIASFIVEASQECSRE